MARGELFIPHNQNQLIRITPHTGYDIETVLINGVPVPWDYSQNTVFLNSVTADTTVKVLFKAVSLPVYHYTVETTAGGAVTPSSGIVVRGDSLQFTANPDPGYIVNRVLINSVPFEVSGNSFTFHKVQSDLVVNVEFTLFQEFLLTGKSGPNGSVTPEHVYVAIGGSTVFDITPNPGYLVESVKINGVNFAVMNQVFITDIQSDITVEATFKKDPAQWKLMAQYRVTQDWGTGFGAELTITNISEEPVDSWTVRLLYSGNQKVSGWNGIISQNGNEVSIKNNSWNGLLAPGSSVKVGLNGQYSGVNDSPELIMQPSH